jgi:hypothetical protein
MANESYFRRQPVSWDAACRSIVSWAATRPAEERSARAALPEGNRLSVLYSQSTVVVAANDAPLIADRAAPHGRVATEGGQEPGRGAEGDNPFDLQPRAP